MTSHLDENCITKPSVGLPRAWVNKISKQLRKIVSRVCIILFVTATVNYISLEQNSKVTSNVKRGVVNGFQLSYDHQVKETVFINNEEKPVLTKELKEHKNNGRLTQRYNNVEKFPTEHEEVSTEEFIGKYETKDHIWPPILSLNCTVSPPTTKVAAQQEKLPVQEFPETHQAGPTFAIPKSNFILLVPSSMIVLSLFVVWYLARQNRRVVRKQWDSIVWLV